VAHLRLIEEGEASGELKDQYEAAVRRAGKVFNIVKAMSLNPKVLAASMDLYRAVMFGPSELSRVERELLAVVVSCANDCHYWIQAHADDLRAEGAPNELAEHAAHDYRQAEIEPRVRALCDFAVKLTHEPASVSEADADGLRSHGLSDAGIHDAIQVIAFFNYINRVAEGVGIEPEPEWADSLPR
jgi:uncharacterized peroxidase-related enzyme